MSAIPDLDDCGYGWPWYLPNLTHLGTGKSEPWGETVPLRLKGWDSKSILQGETHEEYNATSSGPRFCGICVRHQRGAYAPCLRQLKQGPNQLLIGWKFATR
jgi:hypothetical protein